MNVKRYFFTFFICLCLSAFIQVHPGNKQKKNQIRNGNQTPIITNSTINQTTSNISNKLSAFIKNTGIKTTANLTSFKSPSVLNSIISGTSSKLSLPNLKLNDNSISRIIIDKGSGTPRLLEINSSGLKSNNKNSAASLGTSKEKAMSFLNEKKSILKISDPLAEFSLRDEQKDELGMTHLRFTQTYKGVEVWGKEIYVHLDSKGNVSMFNGSYVPTPNLVPDISGIIVEQNAVAIAANDLKNNSLNGSIPEKLKKLSGYTEPTALKVIWVDKNYIPHLAWHVNIMKSLSNNWEYFIDANTGAILNSYNKVCYDGAGTGTGADLNGKVRTFGTYQVGSDHFMIDASQLMYNSATSKIPDDPVGAIVTLDLRNKDFSNESTIYYVTSPGAQWVNPIAISAQYNAIVTYNYFRSVYNRNSIDNKGMTIYSVANVTEDGQPMENAFWSGKLMCYGNGGTYFKPLAGSLDVAAHEMTHGITEFTAALEYQDQSGALNESMSDVFGVVVDSLNWTVGEDIIKDLSSFPSGALRDLANPHNGGATGGDSWQPAKMSEFVTTTEDNGGVHINSGIPNHAFYLTVLSIGRTAAAKIWYRALTNYLTRSSQFLDARIATEKAATDLYGVSSTELSAVKSAWDGVEVFEGTPPPPPPPTTVEGDDWILAVSTDPNDPNSIYRIKSTITSNEDIAPLTNTFVSNRPSVTDTSGIVIFIDGNNNLRALYANPQNPQETVLDNSGIWWSVAVGPGMNYLALTSVFTDTTIYYFDLVHNTSRAFKIAIQSYDGEDIKTALYADALSFDPSGQYLLFDAYNEIKKSSSDTLSYWNINLLDVTTGDMQSVFPPLAEGLSLGNPSFSKTSANRFTFDYFDSEQEEYSVLAVDFNTNEVGTVAANLRTIGYPTYSGDDKAIAYHTLISGGDFNNHDGIDQMPLDASLIEGTGNAVSYLVDATYPVWFVVGSRVTDIQNEQASAPQLYQLYQNYPNPFNPSTNIRFRTVSNGFVSIKIYDILGKEVGTLVNEEKPAGEYEVNFDASKLSSGVYLYTLRSGSFNESKAMILLK